MACSIRVPVEVIKQRKQVSVLDRKDINLKMLYCGYRSTVLRDMPFSLIQFPLWEYFKKVWNLHVDREILPIESATCGAIAGSELQYSNIVLSNTIVLYYNFVSCYLSSKFIYLFRWHCCCCYHSIRCYKNKNNAFT